MDTFTRENDESELDRRFTRLLMESEDEEDQNDADGDEHTLVMPVDEDDSSESEESDVEDINEESWESEFEAYDRWNFNEDSGCHDDVLKCVEPIDYYQLFLNDEVLEIMVTETNRYGKKKKADWVDTSAEEIMKLVGLCLQMGLVHMPKLRDYWSTRAGLVAHSIAGSVMSRKRFETLLVCLHFANNDETNIKNRLYKILPIIEGFNKSFGRMYKPGKELCIDESLVPFRGRIVFKQYVPSKRHQYGIKLFKLCSHGVIHQSSKFMRVRTNQEMEQLLILLLWS